MAVSKDDILEAIGNMSVLELSQLINPPCFPHLPAWLL